MSGFDKRVMIKLFLSLLAIAIVAACLMSDIANEGQGRMRDSAVDGQHPQRSLLSMRRRKPRVKFVPMRMKVAMDPKSVAPRVDDAIETARAQILGDASNVESIDAEARIAQRPSGGAIHIERPVLETPFPFHTSYAKGCVSRQDVENLSGALRQLLNSGVRVFPRNGFLLGIVRHGGLLPHERIDVDLGVVHEDLDRLPREPVQLVGELPTVRAAGFSFQLKPTRWDYKNWRGLDPATGEPYDWFTVGLSGNGMDELKSRLKLSIASFYEYRGTGKYFYPWVTRKINHGASLRDAFRYNQEGGDIRLVDTDEMLDKSNYKLGVQLGRVFDTDLTCFVEKQFYFTTIPVPCDYEKILTTFYGTNWHHIASRGSIYLRNWKELQLETKPVPGDVNEKLLSGGPRPICES